MIGITEAGRKFLDTGMREASFKEYQLAAERTAKRGSNDTDERRYADFGFGLVGETGEVIDHLKKVLYHGHDLDKAKLKEELGDCLWYLSSLATTAGLDMGEIAQENIAKLKKRYPGGFTPEDSIRRVDGNER